MTLPRDLSCDDLARLLLRHYGYQRAATPYQHRVGQSFALVSSVKNLQCLLPHRQYSSTR